MPSRDRTRGAGTETGRLVALAVVLGGIVSALTAAGRWLPAPPMAADLRGWSTWLQHLGPAGAAMAVVRVGAVVVALYLLAVVAIELAVRLTGRRAIAAVGRGLTVPAARRFVRAVAGVGLATSLTAAALVGPAGALGAASAASATDAVGPAGAAGAALVPAATTARSPWPSAAADPTPTDTPNAPTMRRLDAEAAADPSPSAPPSPVTAAPAGAVGPAGTAASTDPPVMRRLDGDPAPSPSIDPTPEPTTSAPAPTSSAPLISSPASPGAVAGPPTVTWTIAPGDHLWHVAAATLTAANGRSPRVAETARYLRLVIDRNRSVLIVADDPDLVRPGQVFVLPAPT